MATKSIRWRPDTCACAVQLILDDAGTVIDSQIEEACPDHAGKAGSEVHAENRLKNHGVAAVAESLGVDPGEVRWRMDSERRFLVHHPSVNGASRAAIRSRMRERLQRDQFTDAHAERVIVE